MEHFVISPLKRLPNRVKGMQVFVAVNQVREIGYRQTTALLIAALIQNEHRVVLADVDQFSLRSDRTAVWIDVKGFTLGSPSHRDNLFDSEVLQSEVEGLTSSRLFQVQPDDLILIRTNPGRDLDRLQLHQAFLEICQLAAKKGMRVINHPDYLRFFSSKSSLVCLDADIRPPTLITRNTDEAVAFIQQSGTDCVVKPLMGSRGNGVRRFRPGDYQLQAQLQWMPENQSLVVQHFVKADYEGDKRVVVLDGQILEIEGKPGGIHRLPSQGDFRANLHAGGMARPLQLDESERHSVNRAAQLLQQHGIRLAGIDIIGNQVIEFNVFSTGGLYDANRFSNIDFATAIVQRLVEPPQQDTL